MRKCISAIVLFLLLALTCGTVFAGTNVPPADPVFIKGFTPQEIQRVIAMYAPDWCWAVVNANEFRMDLSRKEDSMEAAIFFGSRFNSTPESRVSFFFTYTAEGNIRVDAEHTIVTNPGSAFESGTGAGRNQGSTVRMLLKDLEAIFNGTNGLGLDVTRDPKSKCFVVCRIFKGGPADKAGVEVGDRITKINKTSVLGISPLRVLHVHIWGKPGTEVALRIVKEDGTQSDKKIVIGHIPPQTQTLAALFQDKDIPVAQVEEPEPQHAEKSAGTPNQEQVANMPETDRRLQELFKEYSDQEKN
jgi:hypothetical protein